MLQPCLVDKAQTRISVTWVYKPKCSASRPQCSDVEFSHVNKFNSVYYNWLFQIYLAAYFVTSQIRHWLL